MINDSLLTTLIVIAVTAMILWLLHQLLMAMYKQQPAATKAKRRTVPKKSTVKKSSNGDDLTKIEGVGPKIASLLKEGGYSTFADIADADASDINKILKAAGPRFQVHDAGSWPKQAKLARDGLWDRLEEMQDKLSAGK